MILQGNMLRAWSELWALGNFDTAAVVFPDGAMEFRVLFRNR